MTTIEAFVTVESIVVGDEQLAELHDAGVGLHIYRIDALRRLESQLSHNLPDIPGEAKQAALDRISVLTEPRMAEVRESASGLVKAVEYGLDRVPAIVFDGEAVVYGITDIAEAHRHYVDWKGEAP